MVLPGMGVDPAKMAEMQKVSQHINGKIRVDYADKTITIGLSSVMPEAAVLIPDMLSQFAGALATQLSSFFAIKGEIVEVNKPGEQG